MRVMNPNSHTEQWTEDGGYPPGQLKQSLVKTVDAAFRSKPNILILNSAHRSLEFEDLGIDVTSFIFIDNVKQANND